MVEIEGRAKALENGGLDNKLPTGGHHYDIATADCIIPLMQATTGTANTKDPGSIGIVIIKTFPNIMSMGTTRVRHDFNCDNCHINKAYDNNQRHRRRSKQGKKGKQRKLTTMRHAIVMHNARANNSTCFKRHRSRYGLQGHTRVKCKGGNGHVRRGCVVQINTLTLTTATNTTMTMAKYRC